MLGVEALGPEVLADPLDPVRVHRPTRVDRALGIGADDLHVRVLLLDVAPDPRDRPACPDGDHEVRDRAAGLPPELGARRPVVGLGVRLVEVLVRLEAAVDLLGEPVGDPVVGLWRLGLDRGRADDDLGAEGAQGVDLLAAHLVRHDRDHPVTAQSGHHRQPEARVARGRLDQRPSGLEHALTLGGVDHRHRRAVLDRSARVEELDLGDERRAQSGLQPRQSHERRVADQIEDRLVDLRTRLGAHGLSLDIAGTSVSGDGGDSPHRAQAIARGGSRHGPNPGRAQRPRPRRRAAGGPGDR